MVPQASAMVRKAPRISPRMRPRPNALGRQGLSTHVPSGSIISSSLGQPFNSFTMDGANDDSPENKGKANGKDRATASDDDYQPSAETDMDESDDTCRPLKNKGAPTKKFESRYLGTCHDSNMDGSRDTKVQGKVRGGPLFSYDVWWSLPLSARNRIQGGFVLDDTAAPGTALNPYQMRFRTDKELATLQPCREGEYPGLDKNGFPLAFFFSTSFDASFWRIQPNLAAIDWRDTKVRRLKTGAVAQAVQGQLIGITVPAKHCCSRCIKGSGPFESCRVVYLENRNFAWNGACCCCAFTGSQRSCSNRFDLLDRTSCGGQKPSAWILDLFADLSPGMSGLDKARKEFLGDKHSQLESPSPIDFSRKKRAAPESVEAEMPKRHSPTEPNTLFEKAIAKLKAEHDAEAREKKNQTRTSVEQHLAAFGVLGSTKMVPGSTRGPTYDGNWYASPLDATGVLDLPKMCSDEEKHRLRTAYRSLLGVSKRVESDIENFLKILLDRGAVNFDWHPDEDTEERVIKTEGGSTQDSIRDDETNVE